MTFYFYDLETSGVSPRHDRVMQFAGQRTDMELTPIGEPDNFLIRLAPDVLPQPDAVLITGITPQKTVVEGISEVEFLKILTTRIVQQDTIFVGYNSVRFDDEFMRFMLWRNFYDAYEWQYKIGCSRWDLLDLVRMTRALRPDGIKWPFGPDGKASNRLELVASINKLKHDSAHDALSDVTASIAVAKMIKSRQPKLFDYLLNMRGKTKVSHLLSGGQPIIYTSGRYPEEYMKTTVVIKLADSQLRSGGFVYDLRIDPTPLINKSAVELAALWGERDREKPPFPVKILAYNRCPAVAPLGTLDKASQKRLQLDMKEIEKNLEILHDSPEFIQEIIKADEILAKAWQKPLIADEQAVDGMLYDGFINEEDKIKASAVRAARPQDLIKDNFNFDDQRLNLLLPLYKARNYPQDLTPDETVQWEAFRTTRLMSGGDSSRASRYFKRLQELSANAKGEAAYLLEELNLYGQSILPGG